MFKRKTRFVCITLFLLSSMYFMLSCVPDPRILGVWKKVGLDQNLWLTFDSDGNHSYNAIGDISCTGIGTYSLTSNQLCFTMTDFDPFGCGGGPVGDEYCFAIEWLNDNLISLSIHGGSNDLCRAGGINEPCLEEPAPPI